MVVGSVLLFSYYWAYHQSKDYLFNEVASVPNAKVAVLLGTSKNLSNGHKNLYFEYRMDAAKRLFEAKKVEYILVSGDNRKANYNEPQAMFDALTKRGIPADRIVLDYAGFRTLDSMVRAQKVFGQNKFVVISQNFHNQRAVCIARHFNVEAYGLNAQDVSHRAGFKTRVREVLARFKMMLDLYLLNTQPHFLGDPEPIG